MSNREKKIKDGLNKEIYQKLDNMEKLNDDTVSSNEKLSNILDGYVTRMDSVGVEDPDLTLEILNEEEVEIMVNLDGIEEEYNENLLRGETNFLESKEQISNFDDDVEFETTSSLEKEFKNIDPELVREISKKRKSKLQILDYALILTVVICIIIIMVVFK